MPASSIDLYHMQDARNNFDATRPAPICPDANQFMGQYQNIHISTNCYYGYHDPKSLEITNQSNQVTTDCEMLEAPHINHSSPQNNNRKRSADDSQYPQNKRLREDDSSVCSRVGTRSSPSHSASAFNVNTPQFYVLYLKYRLVLNISM